MCARKLNVTEDVHGGCTRGGSSCMQPTKMDSRYFMCACLQALRGALIDVVHAGKHDRDSTPVLKLQPLCQDTHTEHSTCTHLVIIAAMPCMYCRTVLGGSGSCSPNRASNASMAMRRTSRALAECACRTVSRCEHLLHIRRAPQSLMHMCGVLPVPSCHLAESC